MILRMTRHGGPPLTVVFAKDASEEFTAREMTGFERHFDRSFLDLARPRMEWLGFFAWQRLRIEQPGTLPAKFEVFWDTVDHCTIEQDTDELVEPGEAGDEEVLPEAVDPTPPAVSTDRIPSPV